MTRDTNPDSVVAPFPTGPRDLGREIDAVASELRVFKTDTRASLATGAKTMGELRSTLDAINAKKPINWVAWAGMALSIATLIFQAGRYPDRPEYNNDRAVQDVAMKTLAAEANNLEKQLLIARAAIERLEDKLQEVAAKGQLEQKVDALGRKLKR